MASEDDVQIYRGDSYDLPFTITDKITGALIPLTGATLKMTVTTIKDPPDDTTKLFDMDGVINADPTTGKVAFRPTVLNTAVIGKYFYDIQLTGVDGSVRTVQKAGFEIRQDNTK
jgi:hypothetical protein